MNSPDASAALASHFDDLDQQRYAATLGIWAFIATEVLFFGGMFTAYLVYRFNYPQAFAVGSHYIASTHHGLLLGTINTGVLLLSSLCVALGVHACQTRRHKQVIVYLLATAVLAVAFLAIKGTEYSFKFEENLFPGAEFNYHLFDGQLAQPKRVELFFSLYFAMTGLHALHVVIGMALLLVMAWLEWREAYPRDYVTPIEVSGLYWHFVDVVWVFLYPLFYLVAVEL